MTVAFVQVAGQSNSASGTATITLGVNTTQGNVLLASIRCASGTHPTGVSDSRGNTWNLDVISPSATSTASVCSAYLATALLSGDTITVTFSASTNREVGLAEFSGLQITSGAPVLDRSVSTHLATSGAITAATTSNSSAGDLVFSAVGGSANASTYTLTTADPDSGGTWHDLPFSLAGVDGAYQVGAGSASLYSVTWTPSSSANADCAIATYKAASSAVPGAAALVAAGSLTASGTVPASGGTALGAAGSLGAAPVTALSVTGTSSAGSGGTNVTSQAVGNPGWNGSGTPAGLLILLWCGSVNATDTFACTGFTAVTVANGSNIAQQLLWRVSDGSEGATYTVTTSGSFIVVIGGLAVAGASLSAPFDPSPSGSGTCLGSAGTTLTASSVTTSGNGDLLIWLATGRLGAGTAVPAITPPSGFTTALAQADSGGGAGHANVDVYAATMTQATAGATGSQAGTLAASASGGALLISVSPPSGPLPGTVPQLVAGAPSAAGFQVFAKTSGATSCRLAYSTSPSMTSPSYIAAQTPDASGYVRYTLSGLAALTRYYVQVADTPSGGGETLIGPVGSCKTLATAGTPASYTVALVSCIAQGDAVTPPATNAAIADWISYGADLNVFTGDFDYSGTTSTVLATQVGIYETQIGFVPSLASMVSTAWGYYCRSDHEAGPDNGDSNNTYTATNIAAAQAVFPFGTLGDTVNSPVHGLYQSWVSGRVRFIMIDIRNTDRSPGSNTDNGSKTMLGSTQLAWLESQLIQPEPLKVIISDVAWMGAASITNGPDKWWSYDTERQAIISYIAANRHLVQNVVLWHGDSHLVGCTTGANNTWGGFPVYCAAPLLNVGGGLDQSTFDQHYSNSGGECRQYGRLAFTDNGASITIAFQGWDAVAATAQVSQTDVFPTPSVTLAGTGSLSGGGSVAGAAPLDGIASLTATAAQGNAGTILGARGSVAATAAQGNAGTILGAQGLLGAPTASVLAGATLAAAGVLAPVATQGSPPALRAAGSLTAAPAQQAGAVLAGTASLAAPGTQGLAAALRAAGSLTTAPAQLAGTALAAAGSLNIPVTAQVAGTALAGTASLSPPATTQLAGTVLAGTASLAAFASGSVPGITVLAGTASLIVSAVQGPAVILTAAGSLASPATSQLTGTALTAAGSLAASARLALAGAATMAGAGSLAGSGAQGPAAIVTGAATVAASAGGTAAGAAIVTAAGSVAASTIQGSSAILAGAASLNAVSVQRSSAALTGTASLSNLVVAQLAGTTLAATGSLAVPAVQLAGTVLAGAGSLAASSSGVTPAAAVLAAAGSLTALAIQGASVTLAGVATLAAPAVQGTGTALTGAGSLTASAGGAVNGAAVLAAAGSLAALAVQGPTAVLTGTAALITAAGQRSPAALAAAGSLTALPTRQAGAMVAGAGSLAGSGSQGPVAILAAAGSLAASAAQQAGAVMAAAGSLAASASGIVPGAVILAAAGSLAGSGTQGQAVTLAGSGFLAASAGGAVPGASTVAAAGSLAGPGSQGPAAIITGTASLTAAGAQTAGTALAAAGSLTAVFRLGPVTVLAAAGSLNAQGGPAGAAQLAAAGSLNAPGSAIRPPAVLTGAGSLNAPSSALRPAAALAAAGSLTGSVTGQGGAVLTAAGSLIAASITHPPQVKGGSSGYAVTEPMASVPGVAVPAWPGTVSGVTRPGQSLAGVTAGPASGSSGVTKPLQSSSSGVT